MVSSITTAADGTYVCKNGDEDHLVIRTITLIVTPSKSYLCTCYQTFVEFIKMDLRVT